MRKMLFSIFVLSLITGCISCQKKIDIEKEKEAIIAVIEEETDAYFHRDYERWANTYIQDETNIRLTASSNGYNYIVGWDDLNSYFEENFKEPELQLTPVKTDYKIKILGNAAWVVCNEKYINNETGKDVGGNPIEVRILEKVDGEWKIGFLSLVSTKSYEKEVGEEPETE